MPLFPLPEAIAIDRNTLIMAASVLDGLCTALDDLVTYGPAGYDIGAAENAAQLRGLRAKLWPAEQSGPELYGSDGEWHRMISFLFSEGSAHPLAERCQTTSTALLDGQTHNVQCLEEPGHNGQHHGKAFATDSDGEREWEWFTWEDGDAAPIT